MAINKTPHKPQKLNAPVIAHIAECIELGMTQDDAADHVGVHRSTFNVWVAQGKKATKGIYFDFYQALTTAKTKAELFHLKVINRAANGFTTTTETRTVTTPDGAITQTVINKQQAPQWTASAWWLERKFEKWRNTTSMTNNDNNTPLPFMSLDPLSDIDDPLAEV